MSNINNKFVEYIKEYTAEKSVCILGFGREGRATYDILSRYCSPERIAISDLNNINCEINNLSENVELICGGDYQKCLDDFDIVFKSPGIVLEKQPEELKCRITSETQVFLRSTESRLSELPELRAKALSAH